MRSKKSSIMNDSQSSEPGIIGANLTMTTTTTTTTSNKMTSKKLGSARRGSALDDDEFQFDMPFSSADLSHISPLSFQQKSTSLAAGQKSKSFAAASLATAALSSSQQQQQQPSIGLSYSSLLAAELNSIPTSSSMQQINSTTQQRQLKFSSSNATKSPSGATGRRRLYFKPKSSGARGSDSDSDGIGRRRHGSDSSDDDDNELLRDFDIIDVIPGLGEPPRNNQDFEIKYLKSETHHHHHHHNQQETSAKSMTYSKYVTSSSAGYRIDIRDDHFRKPLTKIDVLKAPDNYPVPFNVYCVQEISLNWFLYGGHDFETNTYETTGHNNSSASNTADSGIGSTSDGIYRFLTYFLPN